ncbi:hypothetical protein EIB96_14570 [Vibrio parahaemolyticus]|nr:hypothetical protein [Vibrio parahaemolyticus]RFD44874.1 hypothetical protein H328_001070 [Vibrio parahaemolyticus 3355]EGR0987710.1 hypothetical protein [Vibrio parahaemolyticus]EGR1369746.1 hypothetical protein [Vibrio parahaemolyticus]EGR1949160.1 hypothetical protein [Vibrio parahaemolyticus]
MMLGHIANKQFKSDSARLAFLVRVWFSVYGGQMKCRGCVLHTLIGRYVSLYFSGLKFLRSMFFTPLAIRSSYFSKSALSAQVHETLSP